MKTMLLSLATLMLPALLSAHVVRTNGGVYTANITASELTWKAYKVTGQHHGTVSLRSGSLSFKDNMLSGGEFEIDMTTIKNLDMSGAGAEKLEGHLRSDDFFSVDNFPTSKFVITKVIPYGTTGDYRIYGDLTIKGITKEIKFMSKVTQSGSGIEATAAIKIDRSEFDVRYGSGSFFDNLGDKALHDDFDLNIKLVLSAA